MKRERYWQAVQENDERFDGEFFYAVKSTVIFCRPSCTSRLSLRENVLFFEEVRDAHVGGILDPVNGADLRDLLEREGFMSVLPSKDRRFRMLIPIISNWSERHTGFICGTGTFGLSKGFITEKSMAGRMGSVVTADDFPVTKRSYTEIYEYCTRCRKCEKTCPTDAIDIERGMHRGKSHQICEPFLDSSHTMKGRVGNSKDRYGCGKCQVNVPCESERP